MADHNEALTDLRTAVVELTRNMAAANHMYAEHDADEVIRLANIIRDAMIAKQDDYPASDLDY